MNLQIIHADVREGLKQIPDGSVQCVVTSPPYWGLRSYLKKGHPNKHLEIGQEKTPQAFVETLRGLFGGVDNPVGLWRILKNDGTVWLNLGDSYCNTDKWGGGKTNTGKHTVSENGDVPSFAVRQKKAPIPGLKPKDLIGIPWRVALALQADGWYLRSDIVWAKANCMPESVTDRPTRSHEYIFLLTKSARYFYDHEAIKEPCIYDVDGTGTAARKARARESLKSHPTSERSGIRPVVNGIGSTPSPQPSPQGEGEDISATLSRAAATAPGRYKNSANFEGKKKGMEKQRGHSRRHDGFNERWDAMEKDEQCTGMRNKRDVWRQPADGIVLEWMSENAPELLKKFLTESRNRKSIFQVAPANYPEAHFATFPPALIRPCILAGSRAGDTVLDPFFGSGTTGQVALELGRKCIGVELNEEYLPLAQARTNVTMGLKL